MGCGSSVKVSKIDAASATLQEKEEAKQTTGKDAEATKRRVEQLQEAQKSTASALSDAKAEATLQKKETQRLIAEIDTLQQETDASRAGLETLAAVTNADAAHCDQKAKRLELTQKMLDMLVHAGMHTNVVGATSDPLPSGFTFQAAAKPLVELAGEASGMVQHERDKIEALIKQVAEDTVALDHDREAMDAKKAQLEPQLLLAEAERVVVQETHTALVQSLAEVDSEVEQLRQQVRDAQINYDNAAHAQDLLTKTSEAATLELATKRAHRNDLRQWTWQELEQAKAKNSEASKVRQRIQMEQRSAQQELLRMATAHSEHIAQHGGISHVAIGMEGAGGLLDLTSIEAKSTISKASAKTLRDPSYGRYMPRAGAGGVSTATPRGVELRDAGQKMLGDYA